MPTVNVFNNIDGVLTNSSDFGSTEWGPVRDDASSNQSPSLGGSSTTAGAGIVQFTGTVTIIYRAVFVFNTGGISVAPSSATMNIYTINLKKQIKKPILTITFKHKVARVA